MICFAHTFLSSWHFITTILPVLQQCTGQRHSDCRLILQSGPSCCRSAGTTETNFEPWSALVGHGFRYVLRSGWDPWCDGNTRVYVGKVWYLYTVCMEWLSVPVPILTASLTSLHPFSNVRKCYKSLFLRPSSKRMWEVCFATAHLNRLDFLYTFRNRSCLFPAPRASGRTLDQPRTSTRPA